MITFSICRRHIIASWGRDIGTILWPIRNSIRICGWRLDRLVDPIRIGFTGSPTQRPRICRQPVVFQPLGAPNQYWTPNLRSSWPCSNTWLGSQKHMTPYQQCMHNSKRECTTKSGGCTTVYITQSKECTTKNEGCATKGRGCTTVCTTKSGAWPASRICHEHGITEWWYMCVSFFLAI